MHKISLYFNTIIGYLLFFLSKKKILKDGKVILSACPQLTIHKNGKLLLGNNVVINSNKKTYHAFMHSPVKILIDKPNAEIIIGENTRINGACLHASKRISIGKNCLIAAGTQIIDSNGHSTSFFDPSKRINSRDIPKEVIIEDNVWIGLNCIILPGVKIGSGSVISAGSIVKSDIPANSLVSTHQATIIKTITN